MHNSEPQMLINSLSSETRKTVSGFFEYFLLLLPSSKQTEDEKVKIWRKATGLHASACFQILQHNPLYSSIVRKNIQQLVLSQTTPARAQD